MNLKEQIAEKDKSIKRWEEELTHLNFGGMSEYEPFYVMKHEETGIFTLFIKDPSDPNQHKGKFRYNKTKTLAEFVAMNPHIIEADEQ